MRRIRVIVTSSDLYYRTKKLTNIASQIIVEGSFIALITVISFSHQLEQNILTNGVNYKKLTLLPYKNNLPINKKIDFLLTYQINHMTLAYSIQNSYGKPRRTSLLQKNLL